MSNRAQTSSPVGGIRTLASYITQQETAKSLGFETMQRVTVTGPAENVLMPPRLLLQVRGGSTPTRIVTAAPLDAVYDHQHHPSAAHPSAVSE